MQKAIKNVARHLGVYRQVRWIYRHVANRRELEHFDAERRLYAQLLAPGDLCFDVGANYGLKTEVFASLGARVVAFEPQADCCDEIRTRAPEATILCVAVGHERGRGAFYVDPNRTGSSLLDNWHGARKAETTIEVPITTIDEAIARFGVPSFCKIDVEGMELDVLRGLSQRVDRLSYEFHRDQIETALACLDYLERFGPYEINFVSKEVPAFTSAAWLKQADARRFLRDDAPGMAIFDWGDVFLRTPRGRAPERTGG